MTRLQTIQRKLDAHEDTKIVAVSHGEGQVELELNNGAAVVYIENGTIKISHTKGDSAARDRVIDVICGNAQQNTDPPTATDPLLRELDRRIGNVKKVADWREKTANDYFESFKKRVADNLSIDDLANGHLNGLIQEAINAYNCWCLTIAELQQLQAFKEDVEKGRVSFDA